MSNRLSFKYISEQARQPFASWSLKDRAQFEYFNPLGAYAAKKASDLRISEAVEAGKAQSGAIIAYGTFNSFYSGKLCSIISDLYNGKSVKRTSLFVTIGGLLRDVQAADKFLSELQGE